MPKIEFPSPTVEIQRAIQRSIDLVAFGLQAADLLENESLEIPGVLLQLNPARDLAMETVQARDEFRTWVLANGLRDCVEAIGPSLEWARKIYFLWTREGEVTEVKGGKINLSARISGEEWNTHIIDEAKRFNRLSLYNKLEYLRDKYSFPESEVSEAILSINNARNCLAHRMGVVGHEDIKDKSEEALLVTWTKLEPQARGEGGVRALEKHSLVQKGETIAVECVNVSKKFTLGERIIFSPEEFIEISTTFMFFAFEIDNAIKKLQQSRLN